MRIAIYTLTRDRIDYTKRFFEQLKNCGVEYDHFVLDNGSTDGTPDYLKTLNLRYLYLSNDNKGLWKGIDLILKESNRFKGYDYVLKLDNDLEFPQDNWLKDLIELYEQNDYDCLSPFVVGVCDGLGGLPRLKKGDVISSVNRLGGACLLATPEHYTPEMPNMGKAMGWDGWFSYGNSCGICEQIRVKHDTKKQEEEKPDYYKRKCREADEIYDSPKIIKNGKQKVIIYG